VSDTIQVLQLVLTDPAIDQYLPSSKTKQLKIVKNGVIQKQFPVYKNGKIVLLSEVDSTSEKLLNPYKPAYFLEVSKIEMNAPNKAKTFLMFKGTGLTIATELLKKPSGYWEIASSRIGFF
jgi:hypothetical protein